ncbi:MAG: AAA family ATPase [Candidatus Bathyarchaeia archaeon]|jgi:predicted ATP-dependent endonuclease of OLD family
MRLTAFAAQNFRSLANTGFIPINRITVLTGQNDGGKTSLLDAIAIFLDPKSQPDQGDYTFKLGSTSEQEQAITLAAQFEVSEEEKVLLNRIATIESGPVKICRKYNPDGPDHYAYRAKAHSDPRLRRDLTECKNEELLAVAADFHIPLTDRRTKERIQEAIIQWLPTQPLVEEWVELPRELLSQFPDIQIFKSSEALDPEGEISNTLRASFSEKIKKEEYAGPIKGVADKIEEAMKREIEDLIPLIKSYTAGVEDVEIVPFYDFSSGLKTSKLKLKRSQGQPIDLEKGGEGQRRRITLAVWDWRLKVFQRATEQERGELILAFDEPDTHLDYISQRKIFDKIRQISEQSKITVLVCTHSLNLIDRVPFTNIAHLELNNENRTIISTLKVEDPALVDLFMYQISDNLGLKNSVMLNERCFLVIEGLTEDRAIPVLFHKMYGMSLQAAGIRLLNGEGCNGVRLFAKFLHMNRRNVVFMVDNDAKESPSAKYFTSNSFRDDGINEANQVFFIGVEEFEDAFSDEAWIRAANTYWRKQSGDDWTLQEFAAARSGDFADQVKAMICREARRDVTKHEVGLSLAKTINITEIPAEIKRCLEHAYAIANQ